MVSMMFGVRGGKYLLEHMHWRMLRIMMYKGNENGISDCEICLGSHHLKL